MNLTPKGIKETACAAAQTAYFATDPAVIQNWHEEIPGGVKPSLLDMSCYAAMGAPPEVTYRWAVGAAHDDNPWDQASRRLVAALTAFCVTAKALADLATAWHDADQVAPPAPVPLPDRGLFKRAGRRQANLRSRIHLSTPPLASIPLPQQENNSPAPVAPVPVIAYPLAPQLIAKPDGPDLVAQLEAAWDQDDGRPKKKSNGQR